ncbi:MAG TPA: hypothetical protein VGQ89_18025 [Candidatus Limnocylindrales bacterium]|nr:hypothetical protein [Candidatus Limnocylindrales bacterium]
MMGRNDATFWSTAAGAAVLAGVSGFVYAVAFVLLRNDGLAALMLCAGGLLSVTALVALFWVVREASPGLATVGLLFGAVGALGAAVHGAYDLSNVLHAASATTNLPNAVDPRGFLTFGVSGLGVGTLSALALQTPAVPRTWAWLGLLLGVLLVVIYLGRLIVLDATSPLILVPAGLTGFLVNPIWYGWLGLILRR